MNGRAAVTSGANPGGAAGGAQESAGARKSGNAKKLVVYTVVEQAGKSCWRRVGSGFVNRDGSFNVYLDALPVNGRLHVREVEGPLDSERSQVGPVDRGEG